MVWGPIVLCHVYLENYFLTIFWAARRGTDFQEVKLICLNANLNMIWVQKSAEASVPHSV